MYFYSYENGKIFERKYFETYVNGKIIKNEHCFYISELKNSTFTYTYFTDFLPINEHEIIISLLYCWYVRQCI